jgi:MFS family permease
LTGVTPLFYLGPFITMFDRSSIGPLLLPIAVSLHAPLAAVAAAATVYYLLYGGMQPVWGFLSDRIGRVRIIRIALAGAALAGIFSAVAPTLGLLITARAVAGGLTAAVLPSSIVYIGDSVAFTVRQRVLADLLTVGAVGSAVAALGAGLLAHVTWRLAFLTPALVAAVLFFAYRNLPESRSLEPAGGPLQQLRRVGERPWAVFLIGLGCVEGAVLLGFFTFLAPALESHGHSPAVAGLVVTGYGIAVLASTRAVKALTVRVPAALLVATGGVMAVAGFAAAALDQEIPGILLASLGAGGAYAFMHSTLQSWITDVAPAARGTATALFVSGFQLGAAVGVAAVAGLAASHHYGTLFLIAVLSAIPVTLAGSLARARYPESGEPATVTAS